MTTTIQIRTNVKAKKAAQRILEAQGLNLSSAFNLYLYKIIEKKGIPFPMITENGMTNQEEEALLAEWQEAKQSKKIYRTIQGAHRAILR
jgi:addiction module RelB/DinJ family antitoxin